MRFPRWSVVIFAVLLLGVGVIGTGAGADNRYELSMDSGVEVPERTVENPENKSEEFTITTVGRTNPGDTAVVDVSPPIDTRYSVFFRDQDGSAIDVADRIQGDQEIEFNVGSEPAGSYVVTAGESSEPEAVLPVVIEGYSVDTLELDGESLAGSTTTTDSSQNVTVELTDQSDLSIATVTLTLWTESEGVVHETSLEQAENDNTVFEGSLSDLDEGEYNAQVRIRGGETVNGEEELIGLSDNNPLTVESDDSGSETDNDSSTDDGDTSDTGSGDDTDTDDGSEDGSENDTDDGNNTDTDDGSEDGNETDTADGNDTDTSEGDETDANDTVDNSTNDTDTTSVDDDSSETSDSQSSNGSDDSTDSDSVIEPNTDNSDSSTNDSAPLYVVQILLALLMSTAVIKRVLF